MNLNSKIFYLIDHNTYSLNLKNEDKELFFNKVTNNRISFSKINSINYNISLNSIFISYEYDFGYFDKGITNTNVKMTDIVYNEILKIFYKKRYNNLNKLI